MVGGERRSKVSEDDDDSQRHADAAEEATGLNTPTLQRHTSLVQHRNKRQRTQSGHTPRNPFAKRTAASPQKKKNRHVLDALVRKSPGKAAKKLQLSRSSSFAIKGALRSVVGCRECACDVCPDGGGLLFACCCVVLCCTALA